MSVEIIDCEQNSDAWSRARLGIPTASEYATVMAKGQGKTRRTYMLRLIGERMTGEPAETFCNHNTERGHAMEDEAADMYAFIRDAEPQRVGFIRNGDTGCSPDRLVGSDGLVEVKTKLPHLQLAVLLKDELPPEHKAQVQGEMWVSEREWVDFVSYWPRLPLFVKRVYRDEEYIKKLAAEVGRFLAEMVEIQNQIETRYAA